MHHFYDWNSRVAWSSKLHIESYNATMNKHQADAPKLVTKLKTLDPRYTQITILAALSTLGLFWFEIGLGASQLIVSIASCLIVQAIMSGFYRCSFEWRSALITGFSLALLLRLNDPLWAFVAALLAIVSKFCLRLNQRHIFNPANFAIVFLISCGAPVWLSPGQWGSESLMALLLVVLGCSVLSQTRQWDIAFVFLGLYFSALLSRALYLGDDVSIPLHQIQSSALLIFAFFMMSDPRTIPSQFWGRCLFAAAVCLITLYLQFEWHNRAALFYALFCTSLLYGAARLIHSRKGKTYVTASC